MKNKMFKPNMSINVKKYMADYSGMAKESNMKRRRKPCVKYTRGLKGWFPYFLLGAQGLVGVHVQTCL